MDPADTMGNASDLPRIGRVLDRAERLAPWALAAVTVLWVAVTFALSIYKYEMHGQGYDQVDFEQAIWNTVHGRIMEDSRFSFTDSIFGMDWMPLLFVLVPFYAAIPSPHTLFFLQILAAAMGAVPIYWLGRDRFKTRVPAALLGGAYLLYPTLEYGVLNPFQVRLFSVTLLLFAFYFFEKTTATGWKWFASFALVAMLARTDVALVVTMFGVYGLLTRRRWPWVVIPLAAGLGYFALSTFVIVPSFLNADALKGPEGAIKDYMACWPCGHNPVLAYYGHLGGTLPEILRYIFTHPADVAALMFTGDKLGYLVSLLVPLAFVPLLAPRPLVLGLPILLLNLLSLRQSQFSYQTHYSLLLIPALFPALVYGLETVSRLVERTRPRRAAVGVAPWPALLALSVLLWGIAVQVPFKNPHVRVLRFHETPARVAAANRLAAMVPPDAKVAASSFLGPYLLPRRYIYNFPPAPYSPYNFGDRQSPRFVDLDYIMVDPEASALEVNPISGRSALALLQSMRDWELTFTQENLYLYRRKQ